MTKTFLQRTRTILRNMALIIESFNMLPRWFAFVRVALGVPLAAVMIWVGYTGGANDPVASTIGLFGIFVLLGLLLMIGGGILTANFWRKLERMRSVAASGENGH